MLGLPPLEIYYFDVPLADVAKKKPLGRINDFFIKVNNNLIPVDFLVLDIECNASCPIILGRPFLRTVGAIIYYIIKTTNNQRCRLARNNQSKTTAKIYFLTGR
jgi:hypothetical protein